MACALNGGKSPQSECNDTAGPKRYASSSRESARERFVAALCRAATVLLILAVPTPSPADQPDRDPLKALTEQYQRDRKRLIAENLNLTREEAKRFWPLYEQYERDLFALTERRRALIGEFAENYDAMTDEMAKKLMLDRLQLEIERDRLRKHYLPQFEKVLPVKKLARYYQLESKIRAAVEAGIADELPLIK